MYLRLSFIALLLVGPSFGEKFEDFIKNFFEKQDKPNPIDEIQSQLRSCGLGTKCVKEYYCSKNNHNTDGATRINVRVGIDSESECPFLMTCCPNEDIVNDAILKPATTESDCGYRKQDGIAVRIEGATNEAEFGEFPWMLAILIKKRHNNEDRNVYQCGASLIHPQIALTGAHCVYNQPTGVMLVRAGEWETNSKAEPYADQDRFVKEVIIHEAYDSKNLRNDVALLFLESPFDLAPNVGTVCLPPAGYNFDFTQCMASGWGKDKFEGGHYQNILKKIELPIVPSYVCQDNLRSTLLGKYFQLHSSFICAGGERGKDTCTGDGGSPLACPIQGRYYQAGIVAWGIGCGKANVPSAYVNIAEFRNWIEEKVVLKGMDPSYFAVKT